MIDSLSYIGFTSPDAAEWKTFGPDILGLEAAGVDVHPSIEQADLVGNSMGAIISPVTTEAPAATRVTIKRPDGLDAQGRTR